MCNASPKLILFDVMNTLVYDPIEREIPRFFDTTQSALFDEKHPHAWQQFESGRISETTFCRIYLPDRPRPVDRSALRDVLFDAYCWLEGMESLVALLSEHFPLYALSNYPVWYELIEEKLKISRFLDWRFVSWNTGLRKPDPRAFEHAASDLEVPPHRCLFVDDRTDNCRAAHEVGMEAIRFENADQLADELTRRGLL